MTKNGAQSAQFEKAFATLKEAWNFSRSKKGAEFTIARDACIQRFEYCFDLSWKLLKETLLQKHDITCTSPRTCLEEAFGQHLVDESELWAKMAKWRNLTSHVYYEEVADEVYKNLEAILAAMGKLSGKVKEG
ncbi:MAG: nucleotidyltransferase substrate binding protein [Candidatus Liptonbacteria bacterium]|nr:nucleotidyltransferase substrate binding protein [Candidatus Liptonbacteria bacterium]